MQEGVETLENWLVSIGKRDDIVNTVKNQVLNVYVDMISGTVYYTFGNA